MASYLNDDLQYYSHEYSPAIVEDLFEKALKAVSEYFSCPAKEIMKKSRKIMTVRARQFLVFFLREKGAGWSEIGRMLNIDHSTVIHSHRIIQERSGMYKDYKDDLNNLNRLIYY
jgi:chromosomal replication initiation ATPase DnaA